ncbi:MAG TPA: NAD(P)H nitroreductase [Mycolicibacillus parakoreensis]|nr:NAD(P)H nitroreductase [Mycolicibacillus parakoreensis]
MARQTVPRSAETPDTTTVGTALRLAMRAPSVHNSQPWRWRVLDSGDHRRVQLWADEARRPPHADPEGRDLVLSCGTALHHAVVAFAALGWRATVVRLPDPAHPALLAVLEICRCRVEHVDVMLAAAIPRRRTDRRPYSDWPVAPGDLALMAARAARAGVTVRTTAAADHRAAPPGRLCAGATPAQPGSDAAEGDHAVLLALGTATDDPMAWIRAGEAASVVVLTATALGLAGCPMTEPLKLASTRDAVRAEVFDDDAHPQMLLRIGWAPVNADPLPATPRRRPADTVEWVDDATPPPAVPTTAARSHPLAGSAR